MPRRPCCKRVSGMPGVSYFKPRAVPLAELAEVVLGVDELEALRLAHLEGLYQQGAAERMQVSRATFGRILDSAHRKVAEALVHGCALRIEGGAFRLEEPPASTRRETVRIAFPTLDGRSIAAHFGRSKGFLVLEARDGAILGRELREKGPAGPDSSRDHGAFARLLGDCQVVVARGMGAGAVQALRRAGLRICRAGEDCSPEEAVARLASEGLPELQGGTCGCGGRAR